MNNDSRRSSMLHAYNSERNICRLSLSNGGINCAVLPAILHSPSWSSIILCGIQHFLVMIATSISTPYILFSVYCVPPDDKARGELASCLFFVCGISTLLQTIVGSRLPVVQGTEFAFLIPILTLLRSDSWKCPSVSLTETTNSTLMALQEEIWQSRVSMVQGSLMIATCFEVFVSLTGLTAVLVRFITPLTLTPVIALAGFSFITDVMNFVSNNWIIAITTTAIIIACEILSEHDLPFFGYSRVDGFYTKRYSTQIFKLFPILLSIVIVWLLCFILTEFNVFSSNNKARTDQNNQLILQSPWFRVPYPTQWGYPHYNTVCITGFIIAILCKVVSTVGLYYGCAKVAQAPQVPEHAINRGIFVQAIGSLLDGLLGMGSGISLCDENISVIGVNRMANRRVIYVTGLLLIFIGVFSKFSATFMIIPDPIIGGVLIYLCSSIITVGLSNLQFVNLNSPRNLLVIGMPLFCGVAIPVWAENNSSFFHSGNARVGEILQILLSTNIFIGFVLGIILDNLIPGTKKDRGLHNWLEQFREQSTDKENNYYLIFGKYFPKFQFPIFRFIPILPGYKADSYLCCKRDEN